MQLQLKQVHFYRSNNQILTDINLRLTRGRHYCLIGPNGAGKTTLLSVISGIDWPSSGSVTIEIDNKSSPTPYRKYLFGYFFPRYATHIDSYHPDIKPIELIATGFHQALAYYNEVSPKQWQIAKSLFEVYASSIDAARPFSALSTGERYRLLLLRSMVTRPSILILDEPFDGLDLPGRIAFETLIQDAVVEHTQISLSVLHRIEEIPPFVTDVIMLKNGRLIAFGAKDEVLTSNLLSDLYDMKLSCNSHSGRYYVLYD